MPSRKHSGLPRAGLTNFHFDLLREGLLAFGQMHPEHAVLELGVDLGFVGIRRTAEAALELAIEALEPMVFSVLLFLLGLTLASDRQSAVLYGDIHVILVDLRQLQFD